MLAAIIPVGSKGGLVTPAQSILTDWKTARTLSFGTERASKKIRVSLFSIQPKEEEAAAAASPPPEKCHFTGKETNCILQQETK